MVKCGSIPHKGIMCLPLQPNNNNNNFLPRFFEINIVGSHILKRLEGCVCPEKLNLNFIQAKN